MTHDSVWCEKNSPSSHSAVAANDILFFMTTDERWENICQPLSPLPPYTHTRARAALIQRHEYYLAGRLGVKRGDKVLDCGCGIGGPYRNIARFTGADITGITINEYQVCVCVCVRALGDEGACGGALTGLSDDRIISGIEQTPSTGSLSLILPKKRWLQ